MPVNLAHVSNYWSIVRHIVPTYLVLAILPATGLLAARWLLNDHLPFIEIKEIMWEFVIPMIVSMILIAVWLKPRLRILTFRKHTSDRRFMFVIIAWLAMTTPSMITQVNAVKAWSDLNEVLTVTQIDAADPDRYYWISDFGISNNIGGVQADVRAVGRSNQDLYIGFYFVFPITENEDEIVEPDQHSYWYGIKHSERISNRLSQADKEDNFNRIYAEAIAELENHDFIDQEYFEVVPPSDDRDVFRRAVESLAEADEQRNIIILIPGTGSFEDRTGNSIEWIFLSFGIGLLVILLFLIWPNLDSAELVRQRSGNMPRRESLAEYMQLLVPGKEFFAAPILIDAIILTFLIVTFSGVNPISPTGGELLEWGANRRSETTGGQWWRLVTSLFLHGGIMHLALNVFGLFLAAFFVEPIYGRIRLFVIFFLSGICASIASILWYENTVSVGASGAIFGLFGAVFAAAAMGAIRFRDLKGLFFFVGVSLLYGLTGGIDNAAHLGGLVSGTLVGAALTRSKR